MSRRCIRGRYIREREDAVGAGASESRSNPEFGDFAYKKTLAGIFNNRSFSGKTQNFD